MENITEKEMKNLEEQLRGVVKDQDRVRLIKAQAGSFIFTTEQIKRLVKAQHYGESKNLTAILLFEHCPDRSNYQSIISEFYDDEKGQIKAKIKTLYGVSL